MRYLTGLLLAALFALAVAVPITAQTPGVDNIQPVGEWGYTQDTDVMTDEQQYFAGTMDGGVHGRGGEVAFVFYCTPGESATVGVEFQEIVTFGAEYTFRLRFDDGQVLEYTWRTPNTSGTGTTAVATGRVAHELARKAARSHQLAIRAENGETFMLPMEGSHEALSRVPCINAP